MNKSINNFKDIKSNKPSINNGKAKGNINIINNKSNNYLNNTYNNQ